MIQLNIEGNSWVDRGAWHLNLFLRLYFSDLILNSFKSIEVVVSVEDKREGYAVVDLDHLIGSPIKGEAVKLDGQNVRHRFQLHSFHSIDLFLTLVTLILIIAFKIFRSHVIFKSHFK